MARTNVVRAGLLAASRTSPPSPGVGTSCRCQSAGNRNVKRYCESAYSVVEASFAGHAAGIASSTVPARLRAWSWPHDACTILDRVDLAELPVRELIPGDGQTKEIGRAH